jgi:Sulfotransferase domain
MQTFSSTTSPVSWVIVVGPFRYFLWFLIGTAIFLSGGITSLYFFKPSSLHEVSNQSCNLQTSLSNTVVVPSYLIERAKNRSRTFHDKIQGSEILAHGHPAFQSIPPDYQPLETWETLNFPDISVAGLPKAGTSQSYQILTSHPDLIEYHQRKEFCFNLPFSKTYLEELKNTNQTAIDTIQQIFHHANDHNQFNATNIPSITRWYMLTYGGDNEENNQIPPTKRHRTVNGCHDTVTVLMQRQYLQHRANTNDKLILLLRDPADWLWSAWNFWYHDGMDLQPPQTSDWAFAPFQYPVRNCFMNFCWLGMIGCHRQLACCKNIVMTWPVFRHKPWLPPSSIISTTKRLHGMCWY